jgi:adenylosuccinate lyase
MEYMLALVELGLPELEGMNKNALIELRDNLKDIDLAAAQQVKEIEKVTNHDVKAVEYYLKEQFQAKGLAPYAEFIHFGLTSQDINNTAIPLSLKHAMQAVYAPAFQAVHQQLRDMAETWLQIPMLARTHGQPASPTTLGKELMVFVVRLQTQWQQAQAIPFSAKFGGATGNMNAHYVAYPNVEWHHFAKQFVEQLGLQRAYPTTQIEHYDNLAALFHALSRINTILIDLCRDIWTYVSMDYFKQRLVAGEIGSSAMPHKVNPIDFENAEGNLGIANSLFQHLAEKLPISRLQRDLTDSTVLRNIGVPIAHTLIAFKSIEKGLSKLLLNELQLQTDLNSNWAVVAEAIQTILRKQGYPQPYEALKALTRTNEAITKVHIENFINTLNIDNQTREMLKSISPFNYIGKI